MKTRLAAGDYRFIAICLALLGVTVWFSAVNFHRAFPEASIDFQVNRDQARLVAARFLTSERYQVEGYREASQFDYDDEAKTFLEREAGLEEANRIMGSRVRLWRWSYRWFRPLQKEEYSVEITPRGALAGFAHLLPDDAARPDTTAAQARSIAENFLRTRLGRNPASMDFVDSSEVVRAHRTDRTYTWKDRDFNLHDATYRFEVAVLGDEPGEYREYLKVPEQWSRDYQKLRSNNEAASLVDGVVTLLLGIGMLVVIVIRVRRHDIPWRRAAMVGVLGMALGFLAQLNEFPLHEFGYPTTDSYASFLARQLLQAVLAALGSGGLLFVLAAGAEPLYREAFPNQISLGSLFTRRGLRTKRFLLGSILGITLTGIFIAYQTGFYILAFRFGAWSPADVPYSDLLNTKFPWAFVLFGGFFPAVSEEFTFRMFAIPFLRKVTRSWVAALVLAGFIWGFGHAAYPQQPFWIRGVEVGIGGVALGIIMLRWGILPTLVWHYSVDAMYSAMLLVRSPNLYLKLSGAASAGIIVLPVIAALVMYWRRGGFDSEQGLLNGDEAAPSGSALQEAEQAEPEVVRATVDYLSLRRRAWLWAVVLLAAGVACLAIPMSRFGRAPVYRISAAEARKAGDEFLRTQSLDPDSYLHVTWPAVHWEGPDQLAAQYFLERMRPDQASMLFDRYRPLRHWTTRYFRALDRDEVTVSVHPESGRVRAVVHTLPEDAPGADVTPERAREIAAAFAASLGPDVSAMDLKESQSEKKKARRDYSLVWEARPGDPRNVGETKWRVQVEVDGDRAVSLTENWKPPEAFEREHERESAISIAVAVARIVTFAGLLVFGMWLLMAAIRDGTVRWRAAFRLALPASLLLPVALLLTAHLMMRNYNTAKPLETFQAMSWMELAISALMGVVMSVAAAAVITTYVPEALRALRRENRRAMGRDALVALAAAIGLGLITYQVNGLLASAFPAQSLPSITAPELIASRFPALSAIAGGVRSWLMNGAGLALAAILVVRAGKSKLALAAALVAGAALLPAEVRTPGEFIVHYVAALLAIAALVAFCHWFGRHNWLGYGIVLWVAALRGPIGELFGTGNDALQTQGWIVATIMAVTVLWAVAPSLWRSPRGDSSAV
ncbi:MAG TPA: type II CAAX endopeptidase family protein [Candidatus Acidoferrum sp.]|nr:type II CAAX endopeptidase family protein [Candidatus Acidoferrum sp.]